LTKELISKGLKVYEYRKQFIDKINELFCIYYNKIAFNSSVFIKYKSQYKEKNVDNLLKIYEKNRMRELNFGKTLIGVHLDDFDIYLDDNNIKDFGSEGQQKNAVISLKFAEVEMLREKKDKYPILILDDIFSELDSEKINNILNIINPDMQTFITTTEVNKLDENILRESKIFKIDKSIVEME
jgi:DNA replication and repair protein RecF